MSQSEITNMIWHKNGYNVVLSSEDDCVMSCTWSVKFYMPVSQRYNNLYLATSDSKVHVANMGPTGSCRPHMGPILARWALLSGTCTVLEDKKLTSEANGTPRPALFTNFFSDMEKERQWPYQIIKVYG